MDSPLAEALGGRAAAALRKHLGMDTVSDLLRHLPRRYLEVNDLDRLDPSELREGTHITVVARVEGSSNRRTRSRGGRGFLDITTMRVAAGAVDLDVTFFNQSWRRTQLPAGSRAMFAGELKNFRGQWQLTSPQCQRIRDDDGGEDEAGGGEKGEEAVKLPPVTPMYPATKGVQTWDLLAAVRQTLEVFDDPVDPLPADVRERHGLVGLGRALRDIHLPAALAATRPAMRRLTWDEALALQLALQGERLASQGRPARACPRTTGGLAEAFDARLPFALTAGQRKVGDDLAEALGTTRPLNRLLQGDVGSGKTVVALRAMLQVVDAGRQAVLLAPTEVLAAQHARSVRAMLGPLGRAGEPAGLFTADGAGPVGDPAPVELETAEQATRVVLLTGSLPAKERRRALLDVQSGAAGIVVGTHAVIQEAVGFADLGLVVVDEQHRFGVRQRDELRARGADSDGAAPHLLVMTATPIPRTVALTVYGDLDVAVLDELPAGRQPIETRAVPGGKPRWLARVWERVREEVAAGHQAYVVCPRIGGDDEAPAPDEAVPDDDGPDGAEEERRPPLGVLEVADELASGPLDGLRVEILHGRLPAEEKDDVMTRFAAGGIDVLVATTVVEVGVDVPNATAMVVLDAERFGVSQVHQLRGRVGRGTAAGSCFLVTDMHPASPSVERLERIAEISDGFAMADLDLELRAEGDVLGTEQAGRTRTLRFLSVRRHREEIDEAREVARTLLAQDPVLAHHPRLRGLVRGVVGDEGAEFLDRL